ncbi:MAG: hypothetical protein IPM71_15620 [Bacteroidota bacterium]|nr:MAG: hypothetical protein IPM71_15620 [Bacteroidota bacterium]
MLKLKFKHSINSKDLSINYQIDADKVLIEVNETLILYLKEKNCCYRVNSLFNTLTHIDYNKSLAQINHFKEQVGDIVFKNANLNYQENIQTRKTFSNTNELLKVQGEFEITKIQGLDSTAYNSFYKFDRQQQLIDIPLEDDEIICKLKSEINMQQSIQIQILELISYETGYENTLNEYSNYSIIN